MRLKAAKKPHFNVTAGIIWKHGRILITLRPTQGVLGGLWEFPGGKQEDGESLEECLVREIREELDILIQVDQPFIVVEHAYSDFCITLHAFHCTYVQGDPRPVGCTDWKWVAPHELPNYTFPEADKKIMEALIDIRYSVLEIN